MKYILLICFLFCFSFGKAQYHIRVELYYGGVGLHHGGIKSYKLVFTNDNWKTTGDIMETFDISGMTEQINVVHAVKLFFNCKDAYTFGSRFKTFESCISYNNSIRKQYLAQLAYRKEHPLPIWEEKRKKLECKTKSIY